MESLVALSPQMINGDRETKFKRLHSKRLTPPMLRNPTDQIPPRDERSNETPLERNEIPDLMGIWTLKK